MHRSSTGAAISHFEYNDPSQDRDQMYKEVHRCLYVSNLNFSPFSPDFSPRFLEKNLAHFCSGNFAGLAPGRSGNFDVRYLICFRQGTHVLGPASSLKLTC